MNTPKKWLVLGATAAMLAGIPLGVATIARAQPPTDPAASATTPREVKLLLATVVNQVKRESGVNVLVDRSVPSQDVTPLTEAVTPDNIEAQLTTLTKSLPAGTIWAKVNLPDRGRSYNADALGDYVVAQAKLFGSAGMPTPTGTIEVMGQRIAGDKAQTVSDALTLKPLYILINPSARSSGGGSYNPNWANLTAQQKQAQAQQQAQALLNMSPSDRANAMQQQMATMRAMMQSMTPDQRAQMFQGMGNGMGGGMRGTYGGRRRGQ